METTSAVTVSAILDRYQVECLPLLGHRTARDYVRHIGHLKRWYGDRIACELKPKDFASFLAIPPGKKGILIEDHEFEAVRTGAPLRVQLMMDLALRLGQRQGDLLDLKWSQLRDGYVNLRQGKTGKRLAIEITPDLKRVFGRCWMLPNRAEYVITRKCGGRYTSEGFRALWQRTIDAYCRRGGTRFTFHDLRALCATRCSSPEEAMKLLGHTSINMTMKTYRRGIEKVSALRIERHPTVAVA